MTQSELDTATMTPIWNRPLLRAIKAQFRIDWYGHHGIWHWQNVRRNGHRINAEHVLMNRPTADPVVIDLFALFHDAARVNEYTDHGHGERGFALAEQMRGTYFQASNEQMLLLKDAAGLHERGYTSSDVTIATCWDADRLDLHRVGVETDIKQLCTHGAISFPYLRAVEQAYRLDSRVRSLRRRQA